MIRPYYKHGGITLFCADWRECHLQKLPAFDLLLTDPPYGIGVLMKGGKNTGHWNQLSQGNEWDLKPGDISGLLEVAETSIIWGSIYICDPNLLTRVAVSPNLDLLLNEDRSYANLQYIDSNDGSLP
jgi:DNA modification methylase